MFSGSPTDSLTAQQKQEAQEMGAIVPPGAVQMLVNRMQHMWYELTEDPNDPLINQPQQAFLPGSKKQLEGVDEVSGDRREGKVKNALAFSHCTGSRGEFEQTRCRYHAVPGLSPVMDGVVFDERTLQEMEKYDPHFHANDSGNLVALFLMPKGWVTAYRKNQVCQRCGVFPTNIRCYTCNGGSFCSDNCLLRARTDGTHSADVCELFVREKVKTATRMRQQVASK